ncbi:SDR family NAD(P)-dependent oxidoreductase [Alkalihalobacterium elongatum]|uniref:SDR family NAD(P)-dependent oxidoreductase n=1 Tax=Alkalihalobacterium elongatum TaxID=2675466 RepID=UPI001C1F33A4|nr:glucose 1-dehydrogenase [Alkalihalobacterium elongatum]
MLRLQDKVAVITGGASGIGRATAKEFIREGAKVVVADINIEGAQQTVSELAELGGTSIAVRVDCASYDSVEALVHQTIDQFGKIDVMFNNAGVENQPSNVLEMSIEEYERTVAINQHGVFYGIKAAGNAMKDTGGVIINTASVYGFIADRKQFPYHASKGAVVMMTKAAALDLAKYNIRVTAIAPGLIDTNIVSEWKENTEVWGQIEKGQMRRRAGKAEEVAKVVAFLASDDASFVNAHVTFVDDGAAAFKR